MKKKVETKPKGKEFEQFEDFTRKLLKVPKDEILRREKAEKNRKDRTKKKVCYD